MFKMSLIALTFVALLFGTLHAASGKMVTANGFCLFYEDAKGLADVLVQNSEYKTTAYFKSKDNSCFHRRTHPLKPVPVLVTHYMGYTAYSKIGLNGKRIRVAVFAGRAIDGTMVYLWAYVEEEKA